MDVKVGSGTTRGHEAGQEQMLSGWPPDCFTGFDTERLQIVVNLADQVMCLLLLFFESGVGPQGWTYDLRIRDLRRMYLEAKWS